jgi:hypothetical protein
VRSPGGADGAALAYLLALEAFDARSPWFCRDIRGVQRDEHGTFSIQCLHKNGG